jgi:hypothetical protein
MCFKSTNSENQFTVELDTEQYALCMCEVVFQILVKLSQSILYRINIRQIFGEQNVLVPKSYRSRMPYFMTFNTLQPVR